MHMNLPAALNPPTSVLVALAVCGGLRIQYGRSFLGPAPTEAECESELSTGYFILWLYENY